MRRYLLFCFDAYEPAGGWNDFVGEGDLLEQALVEAARRKRDHWQIVDTQTMSVVADDVTGIYNKL